MPINAQENLREISRHKVWLRLLHYKGLTGKKSTRVSNNKFFLDNNGHLNPLLELERTLEMIKNPKLSHDRFKQPIECVFPARVYWLSENYGDLLNLSPFSLKRCEELSLFMEDVGADLLSYVYIGPFISNPASVMGHGVLMLKKKQRSHIINYSMSYSAKLPENVDPFTYMTKGLFGGFPGVVKIEPFYHKIVEYRKIENRNMWEFELTLSKSEVQFLTYHLWELKRDSFFNYYFFDENCAYLLVALIDLVRPDLSLLDQLGIMVLPNKIPELLNTNKLISRKFYYPSYKDKLLSSYDLMSSADQKFYLRNKNNLEVDSDKIQSPELIDTFLNHLNHFSTQDEGEITGKKKILFDSLVMKKIRTGVRAPETVTPAKSPIDSHDLIYAGIYGGYQNSSSTSKGTYMDLALRVFTHDFTEPDVGYVAYSEIQFLKTIVRFPKNDKPKLQHVDVISFSQVSLDYPFARLPSFKFNLDVMERIYSDCNSCYGTKLDIAYGLSRDLFSHRVSLYLMGRLSQSFKAISDESYFYSGGPEIGFISQLTSNMKVRAFYSAQINDEKKFSYHHGLVESTISLNTNNSLYFKLETYKLFNRSLYDRNHTTDIKIGYQYYL